MKEIRVNLPGQLTAQALHGLAEALTDLPARPLFLLGSTERFCHGLELAAVVDCAPADLENLVAIFSSCLKIICQHNAPTVAVVEGPALGGGLGLAAAADFILAGPDAGFGLPELLYGFVPGIILPVLQRRVHQQALRRLALTGITMNRDTASRCGLVDECFDDEPEHVISSWARLLSRPDPDAVRHLRLLLAGIDPGTGEHWQQSCYQTSMALLNDARHRAALAKYLADGTPPWEARR